MNKIPASGRIGTNATPTWTVLPLEAGVVSTISLSFDCFPIMIRGSKIHFLIFFPFFVDFLSIFFLELSVVATISPSFNSFPVLIRVSEIRFLFWNPFSLFFLVFLSWSNSGGDSLFWLIDEDPDSSFENPYNDFFSSFYLEVSVGLTISLSFVWSSKILIRVSKSVFRFFILDLIFCVFILKFVSETLCRWVMTDCRFWSEFRESVLRFFSNLFSDIFVGAIMSLIFYLLSILIRVSQSIFRFERLFILKLVWYLIATMLLSLAACPFWLEFRKSIIWGGFAYFHIEVIVVTTMSLRFDWLSILIRVSKIRLSFFFLVLFFYFLSSC